MNLTRLRRTATVYVARYTDPLYADPRRRMFHRKLRRALPTMIATARQLGVGAAEATRSFQALAGALAKPR